MTEIWPDVECNLALKSERTITEESLQTIFQDLFSYFKRTPKEICFFRNGLVPSVSFKDSNEEQKGLLNVIDALNVKYQKKVDSYCVYSWAEFCHTKLLYGRERPDSLDVLKILDDALRHKVFLVGFSLTAADVLVYLYVYDIVRDLSLQEKEYFGNVCRWFSNVQLDSLLRGKRELIAFSRTRLFANRVYKRLKHYIAMTSEQLSQAKALIASGVSKREAAREVGVSQTTLRTRLKAGFCSNKLGRFRSILTAEQEKEIVEHCQELDKRFFGLTLRGLRSLIYQYCVKNNISHRFSDGNGMAGRDYTRDFMRRHNLSLRIARKISVARTMCFNKNHIKQFFDNLKTLMEKYKFTAGRIFNMDETGVQTIPNKLPKHIAPKGKRDVSKQVAEEQGKTVTLVYAMNPVGLFISPFFIFRRKRKNPLLLNGGPPDCDHSVADKGYMTTEIFPEWLKHFKKFAFPCEESPVLLILDNHKSHIALPALDWAKSNHIHMLTLPPHTSHKTQPLDRSFFKPFKTFYNEAVDNWNVNHPGLVFTVYNVAEQVAKAFPRAATGQVALKGFQVTGIYPLDTNIFSDIDFLPSEVTDQEEEHKDNSADDEGGFIVFDDNGQSSSAAAVPDLPPAVEGNGIVIPIPGPSSANLEEDDGVNPTPGPPTANSYEDDSGIATPGPSKAAITQVSPADIVPLPKIQFDRQRQKKGMKSSIVTSTPYKLQLMEDAKKKADAEAEKKSQQVKHKLFREEKKAATLAEKTRRQRMREEKRAGKRQRQRSNDRKKKFKKWDENFSETESECNDISIHDSSSDSNFLPTDEENEEQDSTLSPGDFVLVKVRRQSKTEFRLFVCKIITSAADGFTVQFFKGSSSNPQQKKGSSCSKTLK